MGGTTMSIRYLCIIFLVMPFFSFAAKNNQELFLQAVQLQQDKKYSEAIARYEQIHPKGRAVLYNMGLSYYALNQLPYALAYLERAQRNAPSHDYALIASHITAITKQLGKPAVASFWFTSLARWVSGISLLWLQLVWLLLWFFFWWRFNALQKNRRRLLLFTLWGILFAVCSVGLFVKATLQRYTGGVVIEKEVLLRAGPQKEYDVVGTLSSSDQVVVKKKVDNWYLVTAGAYKGWVPADTIIVIE